MTACHTEPKSGGGVSMGIALQEAIPVIALAGNPNTGKSTLFNRLTGLKQHTGNWTGKTVGRAEGMTQIGQRLFRVIDLPGTYTLSAASAEERVAREFICFERPDIVLVVADATALERNLSLVLQAMEITPRTILCVNLIDEAHRKGIEVDVMALQERLGIPVVATSARSGKGVPELLEVVAKVERGELQPVPMKIDYGPEIDGMADALAPMLADRLGGQVNPRWLALKLAEGDPSIAEAVERYHGVTDLPRPGRAHDPEATRDAVMTRIYTLAAQIADAVVERRGRPIIDWDQKLDDILTSRYLGFPLMLLLLGVVFWLTIAGANVPSALIADFLFKIEGYLTMGFQAVGAPDWLHGLLVLGVFRGSAWVISVMLPPMAIFFPIFTLLEDFGYLPRVAFNLDRLFKGAGAHGKQALTMGMGLGCNAAAIVSTRIIESPRERMIAILTNNFVPCNGRFPTMIALASIFMGGGVAAAYGALAATATVVGIVLLGMVTTLTVSWALSKTLLRGVPSHFSLELPPYRKPQVLPVVVRSIYDRTLVVLWRAVTTAVPAGAITWILGNIKVGDLSLLGHGARFLDPFGHALGLDGMILMAFLLGLPANEIVMPILIMGYVSAGAMVEFDSLAALKTLLVDQNGWTWLTALNMMLFSLLHYPCGTTLISIYKETKSLKWTVFSAAMPLALAILVAFLVATVVRGLGWV